MEQLYQAQIYMSLTPDGEPQYRLSIGKYGQECPHLRGTFLGWESSSDFMEGPEMAKWIIAESSRLESYGKLQLDKNVGLLIDLAMAELISESNSGRSRTD